MSRYDPSFFPTYLFSVFALPLIREERSSPSVIAETVLGYWFIFTVKDEGEVPEKCQHLPFRAILNDLADLVKCWYEKTPLRIPGIAWSDLLECESFEKLEQTLYRRYPYTPDLFSLAWCLWRIREAYLQEVDND
jgi:hypothetical protein